MENELLEQYNKAFSYWEKKLSNISCRTVFELINKYSSTSKQYNKFTFAIKDKLFLDINKICNKDDYLIFIFMITIFKIQIDKYSFEGNKAVAIPLKLQRANASNNKFIPFIYDEYMEKNLKELIYDVKSNLKDMYLHQNVPLNEVVRNLDDFSKIEDITEISFAMKNFHLKNDIANIMSLENNAFSFICDNRPEEILVDIFYKSDEDIKNILNRFCEDLKFTIEKLISNLDIPIGEIQLLEECQLDEIKRGFNKTKKDCNLNNKTLHELFEEQAQKTPDNIAIVFEHERVSYRELDERANALAEILIDRGVISDSIIGIYLDRSIEMIVAMLAVLKADGAYLPIDPEMPYARIQKIIAECDAKILLTCGEIKQLENLDVVTVDINKYIHLRKEKSNLHRKCKLNNLAYVIFTSGSTGTPKGVLIEHRSITNTLLWRKEYYKFDGKDSVLQIPEYYFDSSVEDIFTTLISGSKLVIINRDQRIDANFISNIIKDEEITHLLCTPNYYKNLLPYIYNEKTTINKITVAGEAFTKDLVTEHYKRAPQVRLINEYGPTENSVCSTVYEFSKDRNIVLIGKPINNVKCYILDSNHRVCPIGIIGELYLSGAGLARGYINSEGLNHEKFIYIPHLVDERLYKTGDLVKWNLDGNLEFVERIDQQVKIRGYRIEIGEIESAILDIEGIEQCAVTIMNEGEDKEICAYYVGEDKSCKDIQQEIDKRLPLYMHPNNFIQISEMPLNKNGKIDRKALPKIKSNNNEYESPRNKIDEVVANIFSDILKKNRISIKDNFFELGGHSLKVTHLIGSLKKELNVDISLKHIFKNPTVKELSDIISTMPNKQYIKIQKSQKKEIYPLSSAQRRIYNVQNINPKSVAYNLPVLLRFKGNINKEKIEWILKSLIKRHAAFRTSFEMVNDVPAQRVHENVEFTICYKEVESQFSISKETDMFIQPFNLKQAPLIRALLIKQNQDVHYLMVDMHHIISDGTSSDIIMSDFVKLYRTQDLSTYESELEYVDYAMWQQKQILDGGFVDKQKYWTQKFSGELPVLNLPIDNARPSKQNYDGKTIYFEVDSKYKQRLNSLARKYNTTLFTVLFTMFNVLMFKISGQEDIIVGTPTTGRSQEEFKDIVGMFVNTLAIRSQPQKNKEFSQYLAEVKDITLEAFENQDFQFDDLLEAINLKRDKSRNPIFDVMFAHQNISRNHLDLGNLEIDILDKDTNMVKFDLLLQSFEGRDEISFTFDYNTNLFNYETINRMIGYYKKIIFQICTDTENKITLKEIEILSDEERKKVLYEFNDTLVELPKCKTIQELFEKQVEKTPHLKAISSETSYLTYRELNEFANSVANTLIEKGVVKNSIVGLISYNSIETLIGILGILKSGGAYLPIDPKTPKERIEYIIKDSKSKIVLAGEVGLISNIKFVEILNLKDKTIYKNSTLNVVVNGESEDLAYIIYTSGTTGKPKGVMIEHKNLVNYIDFSIKQYFRKEKQVVPLYSSISFDLTITSLFTALLRGDEIITYRENDITRVMSDNKATLVKVTPSHLELIKKLNNSNSKVKVIIVGGEELKVKLAQEIFKSFNGNIEIYNEYGPTETTVGCTVYKYNYDEENGINVKIGRPIQNIKILILDKNNQLCSIGVVGQLCVGGAGVGRGYINNKVLTNDKFIENPFIKGEKIYKAGDLARWTKEGDIEFLGRIDNQIKIRGFRIEISEIENVLLKFEGINEAIVLLIEKDEEKYLCAYYVGDVSDIENIKGFLRKYLPDYMVPMYFVKINKIPLTENGKVDKKVLPVPEYIITNCVGPRNDTEEKLLKIFCEVLKMDNISVTDDFFDLGGHSIKAMDLVSHIKSDINTTISLKDIFDNPTVEKIALYIDSKAKEQYYMIEKCEKREYYPLSSSQKRIFVLQNLEPESIVYNIPSILILKGNIDILKIEEVFIKLIYRHEVFRTSFEIIDGEPVLKIKEDVDFNIDYRDIIDEKDIEIEINKFIKPFDLRETPLIRITLIKINLQKHILMVDMHHIISDGASSAIIIEEFTKLYKGQELDIKSLEYKDYAVWQKKQITQNKLEQEVEYWKAVLNGKLPVLNLNTDFIRPSMQSYEGELFEFGIDEELILHLHRFARENEVTLFMVLLCAFKLLLYKYSGQEDIIVGTPVLGRDRVEISNIVGMFVNVIAIRSYFKGDKTVRDFLAELKKTTIGAFDNQNFQFEELIEVLNVRRDTSRNPIFDVMFSLENIESKDIIIDSLEIEECKAESKISKFDLTLNAIENKDNVYFSFEYCKKIFTKATIERMAQHYVNILRNMIRDKTIRLDDLDILTLEEKKFFNTMNTKVNDYPKEKTLYMLFEEQVKKTPDRIAVVYKEKILTYRELNSKANQLARHLRKIGVQKESKVSILLDRSIEMIIAVLGVMKSGGAYIPLDQGYPIDRINYILDDCKAMVFIKKGNIDNNIVFNGEIVDIEDGDIWQSDMENLTPISYSDNLIYITYTSGTVGRPKGVMLEHRNITNIAFSWKKDYKLDDMEVNVLQIASFSFDVFCGDFCRALLSGGKLVICPTEQRLDIEALYNTITKEQISILESTPALIVELMKYIYGNNLTIDRLKLLILGSDVCKVEDFKRINNQFGDRVRILNSYGLTETAIDSSFFEVDDSKDVLSINVPIGKPMQNNKFYILDKNLNYLPIGVCGELYIGGEGVARGYINNEELTVERFIKNPFVNGERLYKTGDLARWLSDGNVELIGRIDTQVKIRGFRIETSEIENVMMKYNGIDEASVIPVNHNGDLYLCGFYSSKKDIDRDKFKEFLSDILPTYMIPTTFEQLEELPLNLNGKIDRQALAKIDTNIIVSSEYEAPRTSLEERLVSVWRDVLSMDKIGINDNFFELGGHSLKATTLISKIHKELNVKVPFKELFKTPTIKLLSKYIESREHNTYSIIPKVSEKEYYPLSRAQKRLLILNQLNPKDLSYNMPMVIILKGMVDINKLESAFRKVIARNEVFRTSFKFTQGEAVQIIHEDWEFKLNIIKTKDRNVKSIVKNEIIVPFNLSKAPLLRASYIITEEGSKILAIDIHHIIFDGISVDIFIKEIVDCYEERTLEPLEIQYKDYSVWHNDYLNSTYIKNMENYWIKKIEDFTLTILPQQHKRNNEQIEASSVDICIDSECVFKIDAFCKKNSITKFTFFTSILNIILMNEINQNDITIGIPVSGRNHSQIQNLIGLFLNVLLIRTKIDKNKTFKEYIQVVNETLIEALNHQDYPYEELYDLISEKYGVHNRSLFSIMLNYMPYQEDNSKKNIILEGVTFTPYENDKIIPKYDVTFYVNENQDDILISMVYKKSLFEKYVIKRISSAFHHIINMVLEENDLVIKNIKYNKLVEGNKVFNDFEQYFENQDFFVND